MPDAMTICKRLVEVEAAMAGGPLASNQGQALDGYAALANFRALAKEAALLSMPDQDKARAMPGSVNPIHGVEWGTLREWPPGSPTPEERAERLWAVAPGPVIESNRAEWERLTAAAIRAAVAEEREACARLVESVNGVNCGYSTIDIAAAIRARA